MAKKPIVRTPDVEEYEAKTKARKLKADMDSMLTRCRSLTVGSCGGGQIEMTMRSNEEYWTWHIMQPVEVIELIHQLAAQVGCHIAVKPRKDFASWREWNHDEEELAHFGPWAPHPDKSQKALEKETAMKLPDPHQQPGTAPSKLAREEENVVAIEKTLERGRTDKTG